MRKDRATYMYGKKGVKYGVYNTMKKEFQFGICEDSPMLAEARLHYLIGDDAKKWRFEFRPIPKEILESDKFNQQKKRTYNEPRRL